PEYNAEQVKAIRMVLDDVSPMPRDWLALAQFAAQYYHRPLGEVVIPVLPSPLRRPAAYTGKLAKGGPVARLRARQKKSSTQPKRAKAITAPELTVEQAAALEQIHIDQGARRYLLFGVTGSGKTETYMRV